MIRWSGDLSLFLTSFSPNQMSQENVGSWIGGYGWGCQRFVWHLCFQLFQSRWVFAVPQNFTDSFKPGWIHEMTAFLWWSKMVQISSVVTKRWPRGIGLAIEFLDWRMPNHFRNIITHVENWAKISFIFPKIWPKTDFLESQFQVQSQGTSGCANGDYWIIAGLFEVYRFIKSWC